MSERARASDLWTGDVFVRWEAYFTDGHEPREGKYLEEEEEPGD